MDSDAMEVIGWEILHVPSDWMKRVVRGLPAEQASSPEWSIPGALDEVSGRPAGSPGVPPEPVLVEIPPNGRKSKPLG